MSQPKSRKVSVERHALPPGTKGKARHHGAASHIDTTDGMPERVDLVLDGTRVPDVGWTFPQPTRGYEALVDHVALYPSRVDRCRVDDEVVTPQAGDFYGGWITSGVRGPFKGGPGTMGW